MFRKEFSTKTKTTLKKSDKRALLARLSQCFKKASEEDINSLISMKDEVVQTKIRTHNGDDVVVFSVKLHNREIPMFFVEENAVYPTVYTLWKCPNLTPALETYKQVFNPISNGADLMSPGVNRDFIGQTDFGISEVCAVRITGNMAAMAVGLTATSRASFTSREQPSGKAVIIKHTFKDFLWSLGSRTDLPDMPHNNIVTNEGETLQPKPDKTEAAADVPGEMEACQLGDVAESLQVAAPTGVDVVTPAVNQEEMDRLLEQCLLCALKRDGKKMDLPILASDFYKNYIVAYAPESTRVDVKKSSYKKATNFLRAMHERGVIEFTDEDPQRVVVTSVNLQHDGVVDFRVPANLSKTRKLAGAPASGETSEATEYCPPDITIVYLATSQVLQLLKCAKKQSFTRTEIQQVVLDYARGNGLQDKEMITVDPILGSVVLARSENVDRMHVKDVTDRILSKMTPGYRFTFQGSTDIRNGKPKSIEIEKKKKASNKIVTSVKNLKFFEINLERLAYDLKKDLSCSVSESDGVLSLQGDHQNAIKKHLKGYCIHKFIVINIGLSLYYAFSLSLSFNCFPVQYIF